MVDHTDTNDDAERLAEVQRAVAAIGDADTAAGLAGHQLAWLLEQVEDLTSQLKRARMGHCLQHPGVAGYEHSDCGFHWHGADGTDVPLRDGQPVCPRCELAALEQLLADSPAVRLVREFHEAFGFHVEPAPTAPPEEIRWARARLIAEEAAEAVTAILAGSAAWMAHDIRGVFASRVTYQPGPVDVAAVARELADLEYVTAGGALNFGVPLGAVLAEVHRANMRKLGADGQPIIDGNGQLQKPEGWAPPDVDRVLRHHRARACRVCGCTDTDCSGCVEATGEPCWWVARDLCSRCGVTGVAS
jgi:predicted HAD superfamily Cof-like phosphohydrolase